MNPLSLVGNPIKISGIKDLIHKYNNFFFDLDGVIVIYLNYTHSGMEIQILKGQFKH